LLMEVAEEQSSTATAKNIQLSLDLGEAELEPENGIEPFTLRGDYDQLARLFSNLVNNGLQHTPAGGSVQIKLEQTHRQLQVWIKDTGTGIPEQSLPHVFERFYRVDPARSRTNPLAPASNSGTGLGLAIAKAICETHHGQIRVDSKLGQGTTFKVTLPQLESKT
jgi:two-component system, OmpR family, manganese sensing sensor histidine kinase